MLLSQSVSVSVCFHICSLYESDCRHLYSGSVKYLDKDIEQMGTKKKKKNINLCVSFSMLKAPGTE